MADEEIAASRTGGGMKDGDVAHLSYVPFDYFDQATLLGWLPVGAANQSLGRTRILMENPCCCGKIATPWRKPGALPVAVKRGAVWKLSKDRDAGSFATLGAVVAR
jgi:hypothetical protein